MEVGKVVKAKIKDIDFEKKRISVSIRAMIEEEAAAKEAEAAEETEEAPAAE